MPYKYKEEERKNKREYYLEHRMQKLEKQKKWRRVHPTKVKEYNQEYYKKNKEKLTLQGKNYRKNNPHISKNYYAKNIIKKRQYTIQWRKDNPEKHQKLMRERRQRERDIKENFSLKEWLEILNKTNGICPNCKKDVGIHNITMHHYPPISKVREGFIYTLKDVEPICTSCNSSFGAKLYKKLGTGDANNGFPPKCSLNK